jgi:hypothetical protein
MSNLILATSQFCAPCASVKAFAVNFAAKNNLDLTIKEMSEDTDFFVEHSIRSVPTLVVEDVSGVKKYTGAANIFEYLQGAPKEGSNV